MGKHLEAQCEHCGKKMRQDNIGRHSISCVKGFANTKVKKHQTSCPICNKKISKAHIRLHIQRIHPTNAAIPLSQLRVSIDNLVKSV